ncbi:MAG: BON domain-containing protein [Aromatoleum sp.]|nr:BON domain-containing protein [Aromatoleum sp.]
MDALKRKSLFVAMLVATTVLAAGCDQRPPAETAGQKIDRAADKVASKANDATAKTAEVLDDATITAKVKAAILAEPGLRSLQIGVDTKDAIVTLTGTVASAPLKERAEQIAANVEGVRLVRDLLIAKSA